MTPNDVESIFMHGWIVQLDQVRAPRIAAEREILIKGVGYLAGRWCWISRAAERAGRAAMAIGSHHSGNPSFRRFSAMRSSAVGENTMACLNFEMVRSG